MWESRSAWKLARQLIADRRMQSAKDHVVRGGALNSHSCLPLCDPSNRRKELCCQQNPSHVLRASPAPARSPQRRSNSVSRWSTEAEIDRKGVEAYTRAKFPLAPHPNFFGGVIPVVLLQVRGPRRRPRAAAATATAPSPSSRGSRS